MTETPKIAPIRPLDETAALAWLNGQPRSRTDLSMAELGRRWGWERYVVSRRLARWKKDGRVAQRGRWIVAADLVAPDALQHIEIKEEHTAPEQHVVAVRNAAREAATAGAAIDAPVAASVAGSVAAYPYTLTTDSWPGLAPTREQRQILSDRATGGFRLSDFLAYGVAVGLAGVTASLSVRGMVVLFPGLTTSIIALAVPLESSKLVGVGWLATHWRSTAWVFRIVLAALVVTMAGINAISVYSQLVAGHVGNVALTAGAHNLQIADADARIEVAAAKLADVDRRIAAIDQIVAGAAQRGRARTAAGVMEEQRKDCAGLVAERQKVADALADLKVRRAGEGENAKIAAAEAAPVLYVSQLFGATEDPEAAIRWLILAMTLCADPMSLVLTACVSAKRRRAT